MENTDKVVLCAATHDTKQYYFNNQFIKLPEDVKDRLKEISIYFAEKLHVLFTIGFYPDGGVSIECSKKEDDIDFDNIGLQLEVDTFKREEKELLLGLNLWYRGIVLGQANDTR